MTGPIGFLPAHVDSWKKHKEQVLSVSVMRRLTLVLRKVKALKKVTFSGSANRIQGKKDKEIKLIKTLLQPEGFFYANYIRDKLSILKDRYCCIERIVHTKFLRYN